jgi:hypothetical protein
MTHKHNPTRQIELRQRHEDHVAKYNSVAVEHGKARMRSQWEHATDRKIQTTQLVRAMDSVQARHDEVLMARRTRLAELLETEREQHERMLAGLVVTDDQRRERLMQQARDLRVERERLRREEAERRKDQLFREQSALVRDAESRIKVLHVAAERQAQVEANERRKAYENDEGRYWQEQQREEQRQQAARAQADLQKLHQRSRQVNQDLALQVQRNEERKVADVHRDRAQDMQFVEEVRKGISKDQHIAEERRMKQRQIADETRTMNEAQKVVKESQQSVLREEEKLELTTLLGQIAQDERREQERKRAAREAAAQQMKFVEAQMNAAAESETALDRQWQEEGDAQWAKREAQWAREADRRNATLRDVYSTRNEQIHDARRREQEELERKRREHDELVAAGNRMGDQDTELARRRKAQAVATRDYQQRQVSEKRNAADSHKYDKQNELTTAQAEEKAYEAKIAQELYKLDEARPDGFRHVKLGSRRQPL